VRSRGSRVTGHAGHGSIDWWVTWVTGQKVWPIVISARTRDHRVAIPLVLPETRAFSVFSWLKFVANQALIQWHIISKIGH